MCGVMIKTQTSTILSTFGKDYCSFGGFSDFAALVGGHYDYGSGAGVFYRDGYYWSANSHSCGCRCSGYLK